MNTEVYCYSEWLSAVECRSAYCIGNPQRSKIASAFGTLPTSSTELEKKFFLVTAVKTSNLT
jgi:hypothetical protein